MPVDRKIWDTPERRKISLSFISWITTKTILITKKIIDEIKIQRGNNYALLSVSKKKKKKNNIVPGIIILVIVWIAAKIASFSSKTCNNNILALHTWNLTNYFREKKKNNKRKPHIARTQTAAPQKISTSEAFFFPIHSFLFSAVVLFCRS